MFKALLQLSVVSVLLSTTLLADDWSKKFTISGHPDLRIDTNDGAVIVRTWDRKEIEARVTTVGWKIGSGEVTVVDHQTGDRVELEVRIPHRNFEISFGHRSVRIELEVPREIRTDIHTGDGGITVDGLHGE